MAGPRVVGDIWRHGADSVRTTRQVFDDHLALAAQGDVEGDIARNYATDVVLLTGLGLFHGHDGVRQSRRELTREFEGAHYDYVTRLVDGDSAFLEWQARTDAIEVDDGADSFVIRDGRIVAQTIHYTLKHRTGYRKPLRHEDDSPT